MMIKDKNSQFPRKSAPIIVVGMHRSGTSLTASILQAGGVNMGEHLVDKGTGNEKGHFEDLEIVDFHQKVLLSQGIEINGLTLISQIPVSENLRHRAMDLIKTKSKNPVWGWKDPRTTLFLDFWNSLLPDACFVIIYRAPWEVIESLYRRGTDEVIWENPEIAAELWKHYNRNILTFYENNADRCLLINISQIVENPSVLISGFYQKFGIQLSMPKVQIIDKDIFNVRASQSEIPELLGLYFPDIIKLYDALEKRAQQFSGVLNHPIEKPIKINWGMITFFWDWQLNVTKNLNSQHYAQLYFREKATDYNENNSLRLVVFKHSKLLEFKLNCPKKVTQLRFDPLNDYNLVKINTIQFLLSSKTVNVNFEISSNAKSVENQVYLFVTNESQIFIDLKAIGILEFDEMRIELEYLKLGKEVFEHALVLKEEILQNTFLELKQESDEKQKLLDEVRELKETIKKIEIQKPSLQTPAKDKISEAESQSYETEIAQSGLFDENYYLETNPDVKLSGMKAITHYLNYGGFERRNPSKLFSSSFYLDKYKDVLESGMNPLLHFILHGKAEFRLQISPDIIEETPFKSIQFPETDIVETIKLKSETNLFPDDYHKYLHRNSLSAKMIRFLLEQQQDFSFLPKFSIIIPVYNPEKEYLNKSLNSVLSQIYEHWELIIIDDHSEPEIEKLLTLFSGNPKVKHKRLPKNLGVSNASNEGIRLSTGDYIVFMDHDDIMEKDALLQVANFLQKRKSDILYTDDGTIDHNGIASFPAFKPDWSPELALSFCYLRHLIVYNKEIISKTGWFNSDLNGSQDYDYFLRATHFSKSIDHLPLILYHWRNHSTQLSKKEGSVNAGMVAIQNHLINIGINWVKVSLPQFAIESKIGIYNLNPSIAFNDFVSIIIPIRNGHILAQKCIDSIKKSSYKNYEIIIADDESDDLETIDFLGKMADMDIKVITNKRINNEFNYSRINNLAVKNATGDFLIFLNSDTEIISEDWIEQMLIYCKMPGVGIVGVKALFPDRRIQHAGVIVTMDPKPAHHPFTGSHGNVYFNFDICARNYSAVTAACLMISKNEFFLAGGFDELNFKISSNDVDLCLRILNRGKRIVYNPYAIILHHEGASRKSSEKPLSYLTDDLNLIVKHEKFTDSYYNINQHKEEFFSTEINRNNRLRFFNKESRQLKMAFFTHNLNFEGAPLIMFKVAKYFKATGFVSIEIISIEDGPLRKLFENEGIAVKTMEIYSSLNKESYSVLVERISNQLTKNKVDLVYANTLDNFWAIDASYFAEIPSIWGIHESIDLFEYYNKHPVFNNLMPWISTTILKPNRNLFVSKSSMKLFEKYNHFANMDFIYNGIDVKTEFPKNKIQLCEKLNLPTKTIVTIIGTVCERKGQIDFVKAAKILLESRDDLFFTIIGKNTNDEYYHQVIDEINQMEDIMVLDNQENIMDYYSASDIFVCCSYNESFPLVILEAMASSLPIVTTPVFGISEQLADGETALFYKPGDIHQLVDKIGYLLDHPNESKALGEKANKAVGILFREEVMLQKYKDLFQTVALEDVIARPIAI